MSSAVGRSSGAHRTFLRKLVTAADWAIATDGAAVGRRILVMIFGAVSHRLNGWVWCGSGSRQKTNVTHNVNNCDFETSCGVIHLTL